LYKGEADWHLIGKVKNNPRITIPIFGNGDINSPQKALSHKNRYGVDGIMIGRAAIGNPWIFREIRHYLSTGEEQAPPTAEERLGACRQHLQLAAAWEGGWKAITEMRGRYGSYLKGLPGFKELFFKELVIASDMNALLNIFERMQRHYAGFQPDRESIHLINYHQHCELKE
jgi:tRNA-dihydrouridine synthase B